MDDSSRLCYSVYPGSDLYVEDVYFDVVCCTLPKGHAHSHSSMVMWKDSDFSGAPGVAQPYQVPQGTRRGGRDGQDQ